MFKLILYLSPSIPSPSRTFANGTWIIAVVVVELTLDKVKVFDGNEFMEIVFQSSYSVVHLIQIRLRRIFV